MTTVETGFAVPAASTDATTPVDAGDERPPGRCPLCDRSSVPVDRLAFAPKPPLRTELAFEHCRDCNFLFAGGLSARAYRRYYETVRNDGDHVILSADADSYDRLQGAHIAAALPPDFRGGVLDVGCGQGRLLHYLAARFPDASVAGYDVANYLPASSNIRFVDRLDGLGRFDVVVLSHVVEHLVGFELLSRVVDLMAPGGLLYLEVPNPFEYAACPRREFMYYVDRLHVNHFGTRAIDRLLARFGLVVAERGTHRFGYRDGHYPAAFHIATRAADRTGGADARRVADEPPLDAVYRAYRAGEGDRARAWRERLPTTAADGILVYGAGDNFHRALWHDGPLHGLPILAVMDRRAAELDGRAGLRYASPEAALAAFPSAPVVVTVSQGSEDIADALRSLSPGRSVSFV